MIASVRHWFNALSRRERILVGIFAVLLSITLLVYGIIRPLIDAYGDAKIDHAAAVQDSGRLSAKLDMLETGSASTRPRPSDSLHQYLAASAAENGFTVDSNSARGNNAATITMSAAGAPAFFAWVNSLEQQGIRLESLSVTPSAEGTISVNASFASAS